MTSRARHFVISLAAVTALLMNLAAASAGDSPNCAIYANTATRQAEENLSRGCGYSGPRWSLDTGWHYTWCRGQPYGLAQSEIHYRDVLLQRCAGGGYTGGASSRTFYKPKVGGLRLDWCLSSGHACGGPAANAYCDSNNYGHAVRYSKASNIGSYTKTRSIGTGEICSGPSCDGFTAITCLR
jgi:hypothetical protein